MSLALSVFVLFMSLMQPVNEAQFLSTTSLLLLFRLSPACGSIDLVSLTSLYASL